jgi:hypothetical protein
MPFNIPIGAGATNTPFLTSVTGLPGGGLPADIRATVGFSGDYAVAPAVGLHCITATT